MSKTFQEEKKDAEEAVQYVEAELASLREELAGNGTLLRRREFVTLRVARLEKELKKLREKVQAVVGYEEWNVRTKGAGRSPS